MTEDYEIYSIRDYPQYKDAGINYLAERFGNGGFKDFFAASINESIFTRETLPRYYLMIFNDKIIGSYALVKNDFIIREDLYPWITSVYIEGNQRGKALGSKLLAHGRKEAARLGFSKVYLATDHIQYYEKYGFREIGLSSFTWGPPSVGRPTKIYEHDAM